MKLKSAIAFLTLVPVIAFGQVNKEVCYVATKKVAEAPAKLCFVSITESAEVNKLSVLSGDINVPETLTVTSTSRHNEDRVRFKAEGQIAEDWQIAGCSYGYVSFLKIEGESVVNNIYVDYLKVKVEVESVNDTCHETGRHFETVEYTLVK